MIPAADGAPGAPPARRRGIAALALLALAGCPKPPPETAPALVPPPPVVVVPPAGDIVAGAFVDSRYPLTVPIPRGWTAAPGADDQPVRLSLDAPDGVVHVDIAAIPGESLVPRPRPGCTWTFTDQARYRAVKVTGQVLVATCAPDEPTDARVLAYLVVADGITWHVEGTVLPGHLPAGKSALDEVVGVVRFR